MSPPWFNSVLSPALSLPSLLVTDTAESGRRANSVFFGLSVSSPGID
jgi:hypothetical protein